MKTKCYISMVFQQKMANTQASPDDKALQNWLSTSGRETAWCFYHLEHRLS